jgi:large repetitive protein
MVGVIVGVICLLSSNLARGFPVITAVSPTSGAPGTSVDIQGLDLGQTLEVRFGSAPAIFTVVSVNEVVATVPLDATSGSVSVIASSGVSGTFGDFLVPPRITEISPTNAPPGAVVLISGANFEGATAVGFNGTNSTALAVTSPTQIQAVVPTGASSGLVSVTTPLGTAVSSNRFFITGKGPFINSFRPVNGKPGDSITIEGVNFTAPLVVAFNGLNSPSVSVNSPTQLRATVPSTASSGPLSVTNSFGGSVSADTFTVTTAPLISDFSPIGGAPGTDVVINGANFLGATAVKFAGQPAGSFGVTAATQLHAVVPAGATNGPITMTTPLGTGMSTQDFLASSGPIITGISATIAAPGTTIVINGLNFATTVSVKFNGVAAQFGVPASTQINATVPATATSGPLTITTTGGTAVAVDPFLVQTGKPIMTSFTPEAGPSRTAVIIEGLDLGKATAVTFNGTAAQFTATANTQISTLVPDGATTGPISITAPAGTFVSSNSFIVAPQLVSFAPASGVAGTTVTIQGANLTPLLAVRFREAVAAFQESSTNQIMATVPDDATTGSINVITPAGIVATTNFFIVPPTIRQFTPPNGVPGTQVTILGTGFKDVTGISFGGVAAISAAVLSATQLVALVPSQAVSGNITVTTTSGSASSATPFIIGAAVDLAVTQKQSTNLVLQNQVLTYTVTLTNQWPSTATSVTLLDDLPDTVVPISVVATQGQVSTNGSQVRVNLGTLASAGTVQLTLTVLANQVGSITNSVSAAAKEPDLDLNNNSSTQTATVLPNPATLRAKQTFVGTLTLSWPVAATNFVLQTADSLGAPGKWQLVGTTPSVNGTQKVVNLPILSGNRFFRLLRP